MQCHKFILWLICTRRSFSLSVKLIQRCIGPRFRDLALLIFPILEAQKNKGFVVPNVLRRRRGAMVHQQTYFRHFSTNLLSNTLRFIA